MAKVGLVRVPFYPQLQCLSILDNNAPLVMSALLFWMSRSKEPSYCESRHNYQMALHLGLDINSYTKALQALKERGIFNVHQVSIEPKTITPESKVKILYYLDLNFLALSELLATFNVSLSTKLLKHACDDSFDCYDVIEEKFLATTQGLLGYLSASDYERACYLISYLAVDINEHDEDFALKAIAPGWKLLLTVPLNSTIADYAQELSVRFLRPGERAIDFSFTDGNFFFPDFSEIKNTSHIVKHFGQKQEPRIMAATMLMTLAASFATKLSFYSELSVAELTPSIIKVHEIFPELDLSTILGESYYHNRRLSAQEQEREQEAFAKVLASLKS